MIFFLHVVALNCKCISCTGHSTRRFRAGNNYSLSFCLKFRYFCECFRFLLSQRKQRSNIQRSFSRQMDSDSQRVFFIIEFSWLSKVALACFSSSFFSLTEFSFCKITVLIICFLYCCITYIIMTFYKAWLLVCSSNRRISVWLSKFTLAFIFFCT